MATTSSLTVVENKVSTVSNFVKKKQKKTKNKQTNKQTNYNTKITKIKKKITDQSHDKYITTPEFDKFMAKFLI